MSNKFEQYYAKRAREYDAIYERDIPVRIEEQDKIASQIKKIVKGKHVLELACGTGYWTQHLVGSANTVLATDINPEMLEIASRRVDDPSIQFVIGDAYNPPMSFPKFSGAMAHCWFSHVPRAKILEFLESLHERLAPGAVVMFMDAVYQKALGGELIKKKDNSDTWKRRKLENGEEYEILKNYYSKKDLEQLFSRHFEHVEINYMTHFWTAVYTTPKTKPVADG